ncbi:MAG: HAMP domain-containing sensor histidine kinase [Candidatus Krumholzibacteriaceae bacterium]|jgi:signal transduction histidine kinase
MARTVSGKASKIVSPGPVNELREIERRNCAALVRLIDRLGMTLDVNEIARLFLSCVSEELKVKRAVLYLAASDRMRLELFASIGLAEGAAPGCIPRDSGFMRWLSESGGAEHIDEFFSEGGDAAGDEEEMIRPFVTAGFAHAFAMTHRDDCVGVIFYGGAIAGGGFGQYDEELLGMLARVFLASAEKSCICNAAVASRTAHERFSDERREFILHASNEVRTPLGVLKSTLWSLEPDQVDEQILVDMARDALARLEAKVEYLLSVGDIELAGTESRLESTEVSSIVEDVLREALPELEEKQVHVDVDDRTGYRKALIDPGKIAIAIRSIIESALRFVDRGGNIAITIRVSDVPPASEDGLEIAGSTLGGDGPSSMPFPGACATGDGGGSSATKRLHGAEGVSYIVISVKNDGIGISAAEVSSLADPFAMAAGSTDPGIRELGIGLSVSRRIVAGHGGSIYCKSDLGQGAQFSIWLPLNA